MSKNIPYQVKIDELMDKRNELIRTLDEIKETIEEKRKPFIEKMNEVVADEEAKFDNFSDQLNQLEDMIKSIMEENEVSEILHPDATIVYKGRRSVDMKKAKVFIPSNIYNAIVKESITVSMAEKVIEDPDILSNIIKEGKKSLKFNKPKKIKSKKEVNGIKEIRY